MSHQWFIRVSENVNGILPECKFEMWILVNKLGKYDVADFRWAILILGIKSSYSWEGKYLSSSACGEPMDPAERITSFLAKTFILLRPSLLKMMPTALRWPCTSLIRIFSTWEWRMTCRLALSLAGLKKALAVLQRRPGKRILILRACSIRIPYPFVIEVKDMCSRAKPDFIVGGRQLPHSPGAPSTAFKEIDSTPLSIKHFWRPQLYCTF